MTEKKDTAYIEPTQDAGRAFLTRNLTGPVVMLNLLRFRSVADYVATPHPSPPRTRSAAPRPTACTWSPRCRTSRRRAV